MSGLLGGSNPNTAPPNADGSIAASLSADEFIAAPSNGGAPAAGDAASDGSLSDGGASGGGLSGAGLSDGGALDGGLSGAGLSGAGLSDGGASGGGREVIRVVLADDQPLIRSGFRTFVEAADDIAVVGEAATGRQAVDLARATRADVVLMDIRMPDLDGLSATRLITADPALSGVRVLVLTTFEVDEYVFQALRAGASGFLGKSAEPAELLSAIRTVHRGDALLSPAATRSLIARFLSEPVVRTPPAPGRGALLTDREREVVRLVATGMSNDEIAAHLVVSPHTAKTHVNRAMTKLGAHDRAQLVVIAYESGLTRVPGH